MKKTMTFRRLLITFLTLSLCLFGIFAFTAFADGEPEPVKTVTNDFTGGTLEGLAVTNAGCTGGIVSDGAGNNFYKLRFDGAPGETIGNAHANINVSSAIAETSYAVIDVDFSAVEDYFNGFNIFFICRDDGNKMYGRRERIYVREKDGEFFASFGYKEISLGSDPSAWHHLTAVIYSPRNNPSESYIRYYINGELLGSHKSLIEASATKLHQLRFDSPGGTHTHGAGLRLDNLTVRVWNHLYEGALDGFTDGSYKSLTDWKGSLYTDDYKFPATRYEAKVGKTYYESFEQALEAVDEGGTLTLLKEVRRPVFINKSVTLLTEGDVPEFYSYTHIMTEGGIANNYIFTPADPAAKVSFALKDGTVVEKSFTVGSTPVFDGDGAESFTDSDGVRWNFLGFKDERLEDADLTPLSEGEERSFIAQFKDYHPVAKITRITGDVVYFYDTEGFYQLINSAEDGDRMLLLGDMVSTGESLAILGSGVDLTFDFGGKTVIFKKGGYAFRTAAGSKDVNLTVGSSLPGAKMFMYDPQGSNGEPFVMIGGTSSCVNLGFGDGTEGNLTVYGSSLAEISVNCSTSEIHVKGINFYRNIRGNESAFTIKSGTATVEDSMLVGVAERAAFSVVGGGTSLAVNNSIIANVDFTDSLMDRFDPASSAVFTDCVFNGVTLSVVNVSASGKDVGRVEISGRSSFSMLPLSANKYVLLPDGLVPTRENIFTEREVAFISYRAGEEPTFDLKKHSEGFQSYFVLEKAEDCSKITWFYKDAIYVEYWKNGTLPSPNFIIDAGNEAIVYKADGVLVASGDASYSIEAHLALKIKCNLRIYRALDFNIYVPADVEIVDRITLDGAEIDLENTPTVEIDGVRYYKISKESWSYALCTGSMVLGVEAGGESAYITVSVPSYLKALIDTADTDSTRIMGVTVAEHIAKVMEEVGAKVPASIEAIIKRDEEQ